MPTTEIASLVQTLSVVVGVVISILSFNSARQAEATARQLELAKPFYELRQKLYMEAVKVAGVVANPETHTAEQVATAKTRFRELYVAELSMVEAPEVEAKMVALADQIDKDLLRLTPQQKAALDLARGLRASFSAAWGVN